MAVTPDVKRFSQAMKHQFPSFRSYFHPSVQNWSTFQLIYQEAEEQAGNLAECSMEFTPMIEFCGECSIKHW